MIKVVLCGGREGGSGKLGSVGKGYNGREGGREGYVV